MHSPHHIADRLLGRGLHGCAVELHTAAWHLQQVAGAAVKGLQQGSRLLQVGRWESACGLHPNCVSQVASAQLRQRYCLGRWPLRVRRKIACLLPCSPHVLPVC